LQQRRKDNGLGGLAFQNPKKGDCGGKSHFLDVSLLPRDSKVHVGHTEKQQK
jgi:hypothetical protein